MIWCRFQAGETISYGIVEDETVIEVSGIPWEEHARTGNTHKLDDVKLLVPVIPETFYCAGCELSRSRPEDGCPAEPRALIPAAGGYWVPGQQRADCPRRDHRHPQGCSR